MNKRDVQVTNDGQSQEAQTQKPHVQLGYTARKEKQREGIRKARERGVPFGRKRTLTQRQQQEILLLTKQSQLSIQQIADAYAVSRATIHRLINKACDDVGRSQVTQGDKVVPFYSSYG